DGQADEGAGGPAGEQPEPEDLGGRRADGPGVDGGAADGGAAEGGERQADEDDQGGDFLLPAGRHPGRGQVHGGSPEERGRPSFDTAPGPRGQRNSRRRVDGPAPVTPPAAPAAGPPSPPPAPPPRPPRPRSS